MEIAEEVRRHRRPKAVLCQKCEKRFVLMRLELIDAMTHGGVCRCGGKLLLAAISSQYDQDFLDALNEQELLDLLKASARRDCVRRIIWSIGRLWELPVLIITIPFWIVYYPIYCALPGEYSPRIWPPFNKEQMPRWKF